MNDENKTFYDIAEIIAFKIIGFGISAFILNICKQPLNIIGWKAIIIGGSALILAFIFMWIKNLRCYRNNEDDE